MEENLIVVLVEFQTLSYAVFVFNVIVLNRQARPQLEWKTRSSFCLVSLSMSIA
jgi:hypothetical protein